VPPPGESLLALSTANEAEAEACFRMRGLVRGAKVLPAANTEQTHRRASIAAPGAELVGC
jgi:hypothetical protein